MLKNALYSIQKIEQAAGSVEALIELNSEHAIFKGHFPVRAVLPGVCMMQMVKELLEQAVNSKLQLVRADEIKFLRIIEPEANAVIIFSIDYSKENDGAFNVNAKISKAGAVCYKMKASCKIIIK
ncbi:3-hydroxyacyl-ACP dehydratase [Parafilimonas sp.]|uniref:3-hydroxyacyl-ACP dehydratase n=1 Tax=Parafilimonas sp. TaxID=1969739 RepID=UPI0039E47CB8